MTREIIQQYCIIQIPTACYVSGMKRQECLSSLQSVDSANLYVAPNGNIDALTMQPPPKSCRIGLAYWPVASTGTQPQSNDCYPQNGLTDSVYRPRLDSCLSEGEQVNVFSVEEVMRYICLLQSGKL